MPPQQRKYYAVAKGRTPGIYKTWPECEAQVKAFSGAKFKSFASMEQAQNFIDEETKSATPPVSSTPLESTTTSAESSTLKRKSSEVTASSSVGSSSESESASPKQKKVKSDAIYRQVYTDGCCFANGSKDSIAGVGCFFGDDDPLNYSGYLEGPPSNQRAEIKAAAMALRLLPNEEYVEILTDSKYVINAMTLWRFVWEKNDWKTASKKEIQNLHLFRELIDEINKKTHVKFTYVAGHTNIHGNEMADRLAKSGALS